VVQAIRRFRPSVVLALAAGVVLLAAYQAQTVQAAQYTRCALSERDQDPPGGTPAYNLSVARKGASCRVAKRVMVAFHRCRTEGRAGCARRVQANWRCTGRRVATPPLGQPRIFDGSFACTSGRRGVRGTYQENTPACFGAAIRDPKRPCTRSSTELYPVGEDPYALDPAAAGCADDSTGGCGFGVGSEVAKGFFAVVGDSHVVHWRGALSLLARAYSWRGYSHATGGCFFSAAARLFTPGCGEWYQATLTWFETHPVVSTVFVTANADTPVALGEGQTERDVKVEGYKQAFRALPRSVKHVVVLRDTPASSQATLDCVGRELNAGTHDWPACALQRPLALREDTAVLAARELGSKRYGVIDLTRYFCDPILCYPVIGGVLVNGDIFGHLTVSYMRTVAPYLLRAFRPLHARRSGPS
jgi:hypothetical protein